MNLIWTDRQPASPHPALNNLCLHNITYSIASARVANIEPRIMSVLKLVEFTYLTVSLRFSQKGKRIIAYVNVWGKKKIRLTGLKM